MSIRTYTKPQKYVEELNERLSRPDLDNVSMINDSLDDQDKDPFTLELLQEKRNTHQNSKKPINMIHQKPKQLMKHSTCMRVKVAAVMETRSTLNMKNRY